MTTLKVSFKNAIDNEDYNFKSKSEAIAVAQSLTKNQVGSFDWNDEGEYKYLLFNEYVVINIEETGEPLYALIGEVKGEIEGGTYSSVKRIK